MCTVLVIQHCKNIIQYYKLFLRFSSPMRLGPFLWSQKELVIHFWDFIDLLFKFISDFFPHQTLCMWSDCILYESPKGNANIFQIVKNAIWKTLLWEVGLIEMYILRRHFVDNKNRKIYLWQTWGNLIFFQLEFL